MIAGLIRWSARNLLLILVGTLALAGGGLYAVGHVSLDAIPDLSDTQVIVYTEMPGQAPQVGQLVARGSPGTFIGRACAAGRTGRWAARVRSE